MPERLFIPDSSDSVRCCRDFLYQRFPTAIYEKSLAPNGHKGKGNLMKIFRTNVEVNGRTRSIFIKVSDSTARVLEQLNEDALREYIISEHEIYLNELKETRRHTSLELCCENGEQFMSNDISPEDLMIQDEEKDLIKNALSILPEEQLWLVKQIFYYGQTKSAVASQLGVSKQAIESRLQTIFKKIKKILK